MYHRIPVGRGIGLNIYTPLSNVSIPEEWKEDLEELEESPQALAGSRTYNLKGSRPQDKMASTRPLCPDWKEMLSRLNILRH